MLKLIVLRNNIVNFYCFHGLWEEGKALIHFPCLMAIGHWPISEAAGL